MGERGERLADVLSSDRHTVKPWFAGKLDYAPPVTDLAAQGFPLVGGRLDYIGGRSIAALAYTRNRHVINLYVWPQKQDDVPPGQFSRQGYQMLHWERDGMGYWAVSELNAAELKQFQELLLAQKD
ncbi:MAG: hypothetical protein MO847_08040 [Candidatus Protistobacter heckmanni]|nr:hypothetical protein [Candidatus Protistobacter heckmanni]